MNRLLILLMSLFLAIPLCAQDYNIGRYLRDGDWVMESVDDEATSLRYRFSTRSFIESFIYEGVKTDDTLTCYTTSDYPQTYDSDRFDYYGKYIVSQVLADGDSVPHLVVREILNITDSTLTLQIHDEKEPECSPVFKFRRCRREIEMPDGRVVILLDGRKTNFSRQNDYIYRNGADTAYALCIGDYYTQEQVELALGKPQRVSGTIYYDWNEGNLCYHYNDDIAYINMDYNCGLCEVNVDGPGATFYWNDYPLVIGRSFRDFCERYPNPRIQEFMGTPHIDSATGETIMGLHMSFTGEDGHWYMGLRVKENDGVDLIINSIQYVELTN